MEPALTARQRATNQPSILVITVDTLRADHLGCSGHDPYGEPVSPAIDALASEGVRFSQCFATRGQTAPSLCSLMTGRYPSAHGVRDNGMAFLPGQVTLSERLNSRGYQTRAFISRLPAVTAGHPARGVDRLEGGARRISGEAVKGDAAIDSSVTEKALRFLGRRSPDDKQPFFAWVHYYGVHKPYECAPEHEAAFAGDYQGPLIGSHGKGSNPLISGIDQATLSGQKLGRADHDYVLARYDAAVRTVDGLVEQLLDKLEERGLAEDTLVVITADHGEDLGDHNAYYYHGCSVYGSTLQVPWIMRWPGRLPEGRVIDGLAQGVDFVPTLFDLCGWPAPAEFEGVSFEAHLRETPAPAGGPRSHVYAEWQDLIVYVRSSQASYVFNPKAAHPRKSPYAGTEDAYRIACEEFYDLRRDPDEKVDRLGDNAAAAAVLRALATKHMTRAAADRRWRGIEDTQVLSKLAAMGYAGTALERFDVLIGAQDCGER